MRHKTPTLSAHTQVLDLAHPCKRVGRRVGAESFQPGSACYERFEANEWRFELTEFLSKEERMQLSESARLSLESEINLMRAIIQTFAAASKGIKDGEPFPADLAKVVDVLGLSCSRIDSLMRVQVLLQGPQSGGLLDDLIDTLGDFVEQMAASEGGQDD